MQSTEPDSKSTEELTFSAFAISTMVLKSMEPLKS